ncbi:MAG: ribose 5-phosphate isomerase B [Bacilli bacterium]
MVISIGSDHGGYEYKQEVIKYLKEHNYEVIDEGTHSLDSCNYAEYAYKVAKDVQTKKADYGVVICTSGEGVCMAANKVKGVRCGLAYNDQVASLMRKHNNANVISFSQKFMALNDIITRLEIFLNTKFEGGRHQVRVDFIDNIND